MPDNTTEKFASYATNLTYADLTPEAIHSTKRVMIDALGCALGAFDADPVKSMRQLASEVSAKRPATVFGTQIRSSPEMAGLANGTAIRYLDFSDDYFGGNGMQPGPHPSDNLGSILAIAESLGVDGKALILATVLVYEADAHLVDRLHLSVKGWDYAIMHALATALGAGKILGLTQEQFHNAISMAVVANICLQQTRVGELSNWKGMAGPYGSRGGLAAAMMAKHGITSTAQPFEGKRGFMNQLNSPFEVGQMGGKGVPFKIEDTFFKYIPVMYCAALPVWAGIELREKLKIEEIQSIDLYAYSFIMTTDTYAPERADPKTRETADHSVPYLIAAAIVDGAITEKTMTPERYRDPTILGIAKKIRVKEDPRYSAEYPKTIHVRLEATLKSGEVVIADQINPKGHPTNPMSDSEIDEKFIEQVSPLLGEKQSRVVLDQLWNLDKLPDLVKLLASIEVKSRN